MPSDPQNLKLQSHVNGDVECEIEGIGVLRNPVVEI